MSDRRCRHRPGRPIHVDDVDEAYERARRLGAGVVAALRNEPHGQRHFLVVDPNGLVLNVMSAI